MSNESSSLREYESASATQIQHEDIHHKRSKGSCIEITLRHLKVA